ncbi:omega-amidase, chloroplastic-like [Apium graveolens]|uniref:omega-amidase, chloroplastic-like n=1 Tax=Apium graveolens TaxID=4045 RepID=UPI003D7960BC
MASTFKPEQARVPPAIPLPTPPITKFKIGLCQLAVTADKERNIVHARTAIVEAAEKGAKLEIWNSPYSNDSFPDYAEDIEAGKDASPSTAMLSEVARTLKITIVAGSIPERCGDKLYNTCCVFDTDRKLKAKHRKVFFCPCVPIIISSFHP